MYARLHSLLTALLLLWVISPSFAQQVFPSHLHHNHTNCNPLNLHPLNHPNTCTHAKQVSHQLALQQDASPDVTDMHYQVMRWEIDPNVFYIRGEITYHFIAITDHVDSLILDLTTTLTVDSVFRRNQHLTFTHHHDQTLRIALDKDLSSGDADTLTVHYQGIPNSTGLGSFQQGNHGNTKVIHTESAGYGTRDWWPGKQNLLDKIDSVDIYFITPANCLAAGPGILKSISGSGDQLIHHWQHRHPIASYLIGTVVTNFTSYSDLLPLDNGDTLEILNYIFPEDVDEAKPQTAKVKDILAFYIETFGPYPFEKYGHAQWSDGGGTELQTMSSIGDFSMSLLSHELAHMWFGDKVTCNSWQHVWLNEGFATYLTGLAYERFPTFGSFNNWRSSTANSAMSEPDGSVFVDDTTDVFRIFDGRLTYNKGAYVLHMLRWVLGDSLFFEGCRQYLADPELAYGFAGASDFKQHLESVSGKQLDGFFQDWYYGQGYPSYQLEWRLEPDTIRFTLSQTTSHPSVDFFEMPVPVSITYPGGSETFILNHTSQQQAFAFQTNRTSLQQVLIDPQRWMLSKGNSIMQMTTSTDDDANDFQITLSPNPASSVLHIETPYAFNTMTVLTIEGKLVMSQSFTPDLAIAGLPSGLYLLRLTSGTSNSVATLPFCIE